VDWCWLENRLVQEEVVALEQAVVDVPVLVQEQLGWAVEQQELEEEALALYAVPEEVEDLEVCAEGLKKNGQPVDKVQSSCTGILEGCLFLQ